jgi:predicted outer membrane repeat protein
MKTRKNILLAVMAIVISLYANVYAATIEVGSGKPYTTIQSAITAATTGDTILVYDGTYHETIIVGKKLIVKSVNGSASTIIDASGLGGHFTSAVAFGTGLGRDTELNGFTIAHGSNFEGGNISCYESSPTISNCFIYGGTAVYGAGIYCADASPLITNCVISGNSCAYGGGIYCGKYFSTDNYELYYISKQN